MVIAAGGEEFISHHINHYASWWWNLVPGYPGIETDCLHIEFTSG